MGKMPHNSGNIYGNCQVLSPDGILMFRCDEKKVNWYLNRSLAKVVKNSPKTIKLTFHPKGLGNHNKPFGLSEMKNICVCCGSDNELTRHHIVPTCYRKYFPVELKSHNFHDVLSLCIKCHESYERHAFDLKLRLAEEYSAPINGELIDNKDIIKIKKIINVLMLNPDIPRSRYVKMRKSVCEFFGFKRLSKKRIKDLNEIKIKIYSRTHGEIVVSKLTDIHGFMQMWREHFIRHTNSMFLPKNWSVKNKFNINE